MSLATTFEEKNRVINDIFSKMSPDEKRMMMKLMIKNDMKSFFETIWEEQRFLEKETGIDGAELVEATGCVSTSEKVWQNGEEIDTEDTGLEVNLAGKVSKDAENAYYLDEKRREKLGNDRFDGFLGYINSSGDGEDDDETTLEPGDFIKETEVKND